MRIPGNRAGKRGSHWQSCQCAHLTLPTRDTLLPLMAALLPLMAALLPLLAASQQMAGGCIPYTLNPNRA